MLIVLLYFLSIQHCNGAEDFDESGKKKPPLLIENLSYKDFLDSFNYYNKYHITPKRTNQTTLAYVTPWNRRGQDVAKIFAVKFAYISPVWLQINSEIGFKIDGVKNVDTKWMQEVRKVNPAIRIVPRYTFDGLSEKDYLRNDDARTLCMDSIVNNVKKYGFDGVVLEIWIQHLGTSTEYMFRFIKNLSKSLHDAQKVLILVIPPPVYKGGIMGKFQKEHFDALFDSVDYFSLITYDYSNQNSPGPNCPIDWLRDCILSLVPDNESKDLVKYRRAKLMAGLNFYGYAFDLDRNFGRPITGQEFVDRIRRHSPKFQWDSKSAEHYTEYKDDRGKLNQLYFPSVLSISRRLSLLEELGTSTSIWEIGQGLDSFYDQL